MTESEQAHAKNAVPNGALTADAALQRIVVEDEGEFSALLDSAKFSHLWRVASAFARSNIVPSHYQGSTETCMIAIAAAVRLRLDPLMFLQRTYVVDNRLGLEAQLVIALINKSQLFTAPLAWKFEGEPFKDNWKCTCYATSKATGERLETELTWATVKDEGWLDKKGSKWRTMPKQMFKYRTASWFGRTEVPELLLGFNTRDELEDIETTSRVIPPAPQDPDEPDDPAQLAEPENPQNQLPSQTCATEDDEKPPPSPASASAGAEGPLTPSAPPSSGALIGAAEFTRFWPAYKRRHNKDEKPLRDWLAKKGLASTKDVLKADFEAMFKDLT